MKAAAFKYVDVDFEASGDTDGGNADMAAAKVIQPILWTGTPTMG